MNAFRASVIVPKNKYDQLVNENDEDDKLSTYIILNALPMRWRRPSYSQLHAEFDPELGRERSTHTR